MITAKNLTRRYGDFVAVHDVSFDIPKGQIVGLLGHNGAGKTTIMKMVTGYLEPTSGTIEVDGLSIETEREAIQEKIGYLPENCPVYPEMTVIDYLSFIAELRGLSGDDLNAAVRDAIEDTDLGAKATALVSTLSRGYRQRVGVAQAILHRPEIVILDEPTNGLDPNQIQHMRDLIKRLSEKATVILSTHILQEVQAICDRVIVIRGGEKALDCTLEDLQASERLVLTVDGQPDDCLPAIQSLSEVTAAEYAGQEDGLNKYVVQVNGAGVKGVAPELARTVFEKGFNLYALEPEHRDLETVFAEINAAPFGASSMTMEESHA